MLLKWDSVASPKDMRQCLQTLIVTSERRLLLLSRETTVVQKHNSLEKNGEMWKLSDRVELVVLIAMLSLLQESLAPCRQTHPGRVISEL